MFARSQRRYGASRELDVFRQLDRQLVFRYELFAAFRAVDDRDRSAPIALTGNEPVAQAIVDAAFPQSLFFHVVDDGFHGFMHFHARERTGIDQDAVLVFIGMVHFFQLQFVVFRLQSDDLRDVVFRSEHPVTLVTRRYAHDGAGTIIVEDVVGDPNLDALARQRMDAVDAGIHADFFRFRARPFDIAGIAYFFAECFQFGFLGIVFQNLVDQRMFRRQDDESDTVNRVRTRRVDGYFFLQAGNVEAEFQAFTAADPVLLHSLDAFRPARQEFQIVEQAVCVVGDFEEPLFQVLFDDRCVAAPAFAFDDLFVGQYGVAFFAPVDFSFFAVSQAAFVEQFKDPLRPFIVFFVARSDFAVPVIRQAQGFLLACHVFNIAVCPFCRRDIVFDSCVFCRHTESIIAHRMQDVIAAHAAITGNDVTNRVIADMTHVQVTRRIREHFQYVVRRLAVVFGAAVAFTFFPYVLPFLFYFLWNILFQL